jgi:Ca2+-binding EF-hand superfamily protein
MVGLEIFRNTDFEDKVSRLLDFCDTRETGYIRFDSVFKIFKMICYNNEQKSELRKQCKREQFEWLVRAIVLEQPVDRDGYFSKKIFLENFQHNLNVKNLLMDCVSSIKKVDKMIENDLEEHFQTWIPTTNNT